MPRETLAKAFTDEAAKVPLKLIKHKLEAKLREADILFDDALIERIVEHGLSGSEETFQWEMPRDEQKSVSLEFTDDDLKDIQRASQEFQKSIPELVEKFARDTAANTYKSFKQQWFERRRENDLDRRQFENGIDREWGHGINLLWMLVDLCREHGNKFCVLVGRSKKEKHLREALVLLHARGCQVACEIITLLEGGYADGALARWRTLHEINMTALFITDHGEALAEQYLEHAVVEAHDAMEEFLRTHEQLGYARPSKRAIAQVQRGYDKAIKKYGKAFGNAYGWAVGYLKNGSLGFRQVEQAAGQAAMRSHYKMACYSVHAGSRSVAFRLGIETPGVHVAGASNSGLEEPGLNLAHTLTQLTTMVLGPKWSLDEMVEAYTLASLRDEIAEAFVTAEINIRREQAMIQRSIIMR